MTAPLSQDLRKRLVRTVEEGSSAREAAARFAVSPSAAIKLVRRVRETGSTEPAKIGGYRKPLLASHEELLRELTASRKGITLAEIREELVARGIEPGCLTTIWSTLKRLGLSHKKEPESRRAGSSGRGRPPRSLAGLAARHGPDFVHRPRRDRRHHQHGPPLRLGAQGERLVDAAPHGHWRTTTFIAGLRSTGTIAPLVLDWSMTGEAFRAYVEQFSRPACRRAMSW
jgi:transposase